MQSSGAREGEWERWLAVGRALAKTDPVVYEALMEAMLRKIAVIRARKQRVISFVSFRS